MLARKNIRSDQYLTLPHQIIRYFVILVRVVFACHFLRCVAGDEPVGVTGEDFVGNHNRNQLVTVVECSDGELPAAELLLNLFGDEDGFDFVVLREVVGHAFVAAGGHALALAVVVDDLFDLPGEFLAFGFGLAFGVELPVAFEFFQSGLFYRLGGFIHGFGFAVALLFDLLMLFGARFMDLALVGQSGFFQLIEEGVAHSMTPFIVCWGSCVTPTYNPALVGQSRHL